jgi:hypothetical protein
VLLPTGTRSLVSLPPSRQALRSLNFNFIRDIARVAGIIRQPLVMVVHPSFPAKTVQEFAACDGLASARHIWSVGQRFEIFGHEGTTAGGTRRF